MLDIFIKYGEEDYKIAKNIAYCIVEERKNEHIQTTRQLSELIQKVKQKVKINRKNKRKQKTHPAQKIFQALRIHINRELEVLERMLQSSFNILSAGGKIGIISFHSLEDRIVKKFFKLYSRECLCPKEILQCNCKEIFPKRLVIHKPFPIIPNEEEIQKNPRSRSAKLRIATVKIL